jgi:hypothetical protein
VCLSRLSAYPPHVRPDSKYRLNPGISKEMAASCRQLVPAEPLRAAFPTVKVQFAESSRSPRSRGLPASALAMRPRRFLPPFGYQPKHAGRRGREGERRGREPVAVGPPLRVEVDSSSPIISPPPDGQTWPVPTLRTRNLSVRVTGLYPPHWRRRAQLAKLPFLAPSQPSRALKLGPFPQLVTMVLPLSCHRVASGPPQHLVGLSQQHRSPWWDCLCHRLLACFPFFLPVKLRAVGTASPRTGESGDS